MKFKRLTAFAVVATMVLGSSITAFADGVDGSGIVEYDDSTAIEYDSVTLPTLTASKYNFEVDPTGLLHKFDPETYVDGSVYFTSLSTYASLVPKTGATLYELKKVELEPDETSGNWEDIVTATTDSDTGVITVSAIAADLFVWTPVATAPSEFTSGTSGEYTALTKDNFSKWFDVVSPAADTYELKLKSNYLAGTDVCNGKIYQNTFEAIPAAGIVEADGSAVKVADYATITSGAVSAYTNVYDKTGSTGDNTDYVMLAANSDKMVYTAPEATKNSKTDSVDVTNLSTKDKVVQADIVMSNADTLTFKDENSFDAGDDTTSVYFAATDGTAGNTVPFELSTDGTKATATFKVTVGKKTDGDDITYQTDEVNAHGGGHTYKRYEGPDPTYNTQAFWITAAANTDAAAKEAWEGWAKDLTATTRPSINIVYSITDFVDTYDVTFKSGVDGINDSVEAVNEGGNPNGNTAKAAFEAAREGWTVTGWSATAGGTEAADLTEITSATTLHAIWSQNITDATGYGQWSSDWKKIWVGVNENDGFESDTVTVEVSADGNDYVAFTDFRYDSGWVEITWADVVSKLGSEPAKAYIRVLDGATRYTYHD